jgi:uncharacterized protein (TIGR02118 family)
MSEATTPFRCLAVLESPSGTDMAEAQMAWQQDDPFAALREEGVVRYVRGLSVPTTDPALAQRSRIGVAHLWVDDEAVAVKLAARLRSGEIHRANPVLGPTRIIALPVVQRYQLGIADDAGTTPLRAIFLVKRREGMSAEAFHRHWREVHGPMLIGQAGITRYAQLHRAAASYDGGPEFDGVAELSFPDELAYAAFGRSEPHRTNQMADLPNLFDLTVGKRFFSREEVVF